VRDRADETLLVQGASNTRILVHLLSGKETTLPPSPPLRTVRAAFTAYRSSLSNALLRTRFHNR
jgi:hypothetical protein